MASPETITPTDDGWAGNQSPDNQTWATIRAAAGTNKQAQADGSSESIAIRQGTTSGWNLMRRAQFCVASTLISGQNILAAKLRLYVNSKDEGIPSQSLVLCNGGPAGTSLVAGDYEGNVANTTVWGDTVTGAALTTSAYNEWNFDATGIAGLQAQIAGGNFKFQIRYTSDRANSEPGRVGAGILCTMNWNFGNAASNKSQLVVTYGAAPSTGANQSYAFFMSLALGIVAWGISHLFEGGHMTLQNVWNGERVAVLPI